MVDQIDEERAVLVDTENEKRTLKEHLDEIREDLSNLQGSTVSAYETKLNLLTGSIHSEIQMLEKLIIQEDESFKQDASSKAIIFQQEKEKLLTMLAQPAEKITTSVVQESELESEPEQRTKTTKALSEKAHSTASQKEQHDNTTSPLSQLSQTGQVKRSHTKVTTKPHGRDVDSVVSSNIYTKPTGGVFAGGHTGYKLNAARVKQPANTNAPQRSLVTTLSDNVAFTFNASEVLAKQLSDARVRKGTEDTKTPIKSAFASKRAFGKK